MKYIHFIIDTYFIIITLFILFYIFLFLKEKITKKLNQKRKLYYRKVITEQMYSIKNKKIFSKEHIDFLTKELTNIHHLLLFEEVLSSLAKKDQDATEKYCIQISDAFAYLIRYYRRRNSIEKAYFTYILSLFPMLMHHHDHLLDYAMMSFVLDPSIYCRENAMLFFYQQGSVYSVIHSLQKIDKRNLYYSPKLLADDLLKFTGDSIQLSSLLLENFNTFSIPFQIAIVHYIRFSGINQKENLYQKLISKKYDKEVDLAIIRYFARYPYPKVTELFLCFMQDKNTYDFEYRIVTAFALSSYDKEETRKVLIESLADPNFYVRKNASLSLMKMNVTPLEIQNALHTDDTYQKEMLQDIWEEKIWEEDLQENKKGEDLDVICVSV